MKIVHIITSLHGGGRERRLVQLVKGISKAQSSIKQYILILTPIVDYEEAHEYASIIHLKHSSRLELAKSIQTNLTTIKPDIVHDWCGIPLVLTCLTILKKKLGYKYVEGFIADGNPLTNILSRVSTKIAFKAADAIVSNSHAGLVAKHAVLSKSHVVYNGFDYARLCGTTEQDIHNLRKELGIDEKSYIISMLARLEPAKDWETFLHTAKLIQEKRSDVVFLSVGKGSKYDSIVAKQKQMKVTNVKFLGFRKDAECIIAASHLTLLFSNDKVHAEGISNSIMESMAQGVPVIASNGGGTPEIISNGIDGFIVPFQDAVAATNKIIYLLENPQNHNRMSDSAIKKIKEHFLLENMTQRYLEIYNKVL